MRVGTMNRNVDVQRTHGRFPTVRGENPPQGIRYRSLEVRCWPSRITFQLRWWRW